MFTKFMFRQQMLNWRMNLIPLFYLSFCAIPQNIRAQVNSGSDGHDGAFNPTTNTIINMADHPDGIYQYTSVSIPSGVTVSFAPNVANTPVVWLVQTSCAITGTLDLSASNVETTIGTFGGCGGFKGGCGAYNSTLRGAGQGPGGGKVDDLSKNSGNASFGSIGTVGQYGQQNQAGDQYGNTYLLPLIGGSGGGGPGGGGGGAILIAASSINVVGRIQANGGHGSRHGGWNVVIGGGGGGSGGAIRLVATTVSGSGVLSTIGGNGLNGYNAGFLYGAAGNGRIRIDAYEDLFVGTLSGSVSRGMQPIIMAPVDVVCTLEIRAVGDVLVATSPRGLLTTPDVIIPGNQQNPIPITVQCANIPLNTEIIVEIKPANGSAIRAVGVNDTGTQASSTATVSVNMPRGGGTIQAKAVSGIIENIYGAVLNNERNHSLAQTGLTVNGERFSAVEVTATLGGSQSVAYITTSGTRYSLSSRN